MSIPVHATESSIAAIAYPGVMGAQELNDQLDLPRPPGVIRRLMHEHPHWVDGILATAYLLAVIGFAVLGGFLPENLDDPLAWTTPSYLRLPMVLLLCAIVVVTCIALVMRRRYPLSSLVLVLASTMLAPEDMVPMAAGTFALAVLLYSVPVYRSVRAGWIGYGLAVVATLVPVSYSWEVGGEEMTSVGEEITVAVTSALITMVPLVIGINAGSRRRYTEAIIDRAHQLAKERDQRARLAVAEERTRIAREMHDIVAHSVSVMVTLSEGAAHVVESEPLDAKSAMQHSAETGRSALAEMRRLIGVLRDQDAAEFSPTASLDTLPELIEDFRAAGLTVHMTFKGAAHDDADQGRELALYRIVQEALTNTLRHAGPGANASVVIDQGAHGATVRIEDDGGLPGSVAPMTGLGSGHGLIGLAERLRVYHGTLDYGATVSGGWAVTAALPAGQELGTDD